MWHVAAALAPLPLIGLGYASIPGNQLAYRMELLFSGNGSVHALSRDAGATEHQPLPKSAAALFRTEGKGPRADQYLVVKTTTYADKQFVAASVSGDDSAASGREFAKRADPVDKVRSPQCGVTEVALRGAPTAAIRAAASRCSPNSPLALSNWRRPLPVGRQRPRPSPTAPPRPGLDFKYKGESQAEFEERERRCLSTAIYFEARGEPLQGQIAVGQVIMNRVRSPQFPETICGVVYQGQMAPGCQFSFACDGKTDTPKNDSHWALAQKLARQITSGEVWLPEIGYSTFYHADYVSPYWKSTMNKIDSIGRHIFYKKRNEKAYIVEEASAAPAPSTSKVNAGAFSLASSNPAATPISATPALSLGAAPSE